MIKCVASDLDGTLLYKGELSANNFKAIKLLKENDIKFIIASGRNISEAKLLNLNGYTCPKVLINGAVVVDEDYNVIFKDPLNGSDVESLYLLANQVNVGAIFYGLNTRYFFNSEIMIDSFVRTNNINAFGEEFFKDFIKIDSLSEVKEDIYKCEIMDGCNFRLLTDIKDELSKEEPSLLVTSSDVNNLEIISKRVNKYNGLKVLLNNYGFSKEEVAIFGDSDNDLALFENVKESYAMQDGQEHVKALAKHVCRTCKEDGFYYSVLDILNDNKKR